jgi:hypothetical protein
MPSIIRIRYTEDNDKWAGESNKDYPAPDWKAKVNIRVDIDGLVMFRTAGLGVAHTGVMNVFSGVIWLCAVVPRIVEVEHNIGGFKTGPYSDPKTHKTKHNTPQGPETEAFVPRGVMPSKKEMMLHGGKHLRPIEHNAPQQGGRLPLGSSHEQLAKDAEGIGRDVGQGVPVSNTLSYIGFTITKWEGSEFWPHEIIYRSGTFNQRFSANGKGIPGDWARLIRDALQELLPALPIQTRSERTVEYRQGKEPTVEARRVPKTYSKYFGRI